MKVVLAQINPTIGDCAGNTRKILEWMNTAAKEGASLVLFPELALTGYPPQDLLDTPSFVEQNLRSLRTIETHTKGITAVVGYVEKNLAPTGQRFFNAAAVLKDGKTTGIYKKQLLPNYDVFDEKRYFEPGESALTFDQGDLRFAVTICEDVWNQPGYLPRTYSTDPLAAVRLANVDWVINLSASPFHLGKPALREDLFRQVSRKVRAGFLFCNQVGGNDDLIFDGGSAAWNQSGVPFARAPSFEEALCVVDLSDKTTGSGVLSPTPTESAEWLLKALCLGLRDYIRKSGGTKVCLGLSGGIDSSVCAAIAVQALGPSKVLGLLLPTEFTTEASTHDALALARALGIDTKTLPVQGLFDEASRQLHTAAGHPLRALTMENLQPRLRMVLLMGIANEERRLLLNTSNKSEIATGYATLYGDSAGALSVLGDLTKDQIYAMGRLLCHSGIGIPQRVFDRPPTAELREGQKDEDSLPPYRTLDPMVRQAIEQGAEAEMLRGSFPPDEVDTFLRLYRASEYKRRQSPPILRVSSRAFGRGRRIPLAAIKPW